MIKFILILLLFFLIIFLLFKNFNTSKFKLKKTSLVVIIFLIGIILFFLFKGKSNLIISNLINFFKNIVPYLLKFLSFY